MDPNQATDFELKTLVLKISQTVERLGIKVQDQNDHVVSLQNETTDLGRRMSLQEHYSGED